MTSFVICCFILFAFGLLVESHNFSFPLASVWNQDISSASVASNSAATISYLSSLSSDGWGSTHFQVDFSMNIQYMTATTPKVQLIQSSGYYLPDCDDVSTFPLVPGGAIEGPTPYGSCSGDCHYLVVDKTNNVLWESYNTQVDTNANTITSDCVVKWDLCRNYPASGRGDQCTSTDAAGFPVAALLFDADEMATGAINHALRFILPNNYMAHGYYVHPASHAGGPSSTNPNAPIYGTHLRLKPSFSSSQLTNGATAGALIVVAALQKYGMFLADGGNIPSTAVDDTYTTAKYTDFNFDSHSLFGITANDFEVIAYDTPIVLTYNCVRNYFNESACQGTSGTSVEATSSSTSSPTTSSSSPAGSSTTSSLGHATTSSSTSSTISAGVSSSSATSGTVTISIASSLMVESALLSGALMFLLSFT